MRRGMVAWTATAACVGLASCVQVQVGPERVLDPAATPFIVATYNIRHGEGMDSVVDLNRTAAAIRALNADVIALQEVDVNTVRTGKIDQPDSLAKLLGMDVRFAAFMPYQGGQYGLAILSRHPIVGDEVLRLPDGNEPRVALLVRVARQGETVVVVNVHFDWVEDDAFRVQQATVVRDRLLQERRPFVLLGDFNDVPGSRTMMLFSSGFTEVAKAGTGATWPSDAPVKSIDHVYVGPTASWARGGAVVQAERRASDHRAVVATLRRIGP